MKTASTQPLQFSGYPLQVIETATEQKPPAIPEIGEKKPSSPQENRMTDAPENWDDSWFANYE